MAVSRVNKNVLIRQIKVGENNAATPLSDVARYETRIRMELSFCYGICAVMYHSVPFPSIVIESYCAARD